ncbi:hypothetical protein AYO20_10333 [Fonsecaea nubica]|uniref:Uncharacterized protein n=1 Tax=Fonsecaea nubica TaxID=856822 RepID=A0A178CB00_9EURO|nr:hypothetical protein AYO20_10333 [Fonsecaea nubica]OAL25871.1 hypothetical protein AYO20_10333 [Fonsecaea nubica]
MATEYRGHGTPLAELGVRYFNAAGPQREMAALAHLSNTVTVPSNVTTVHITGQLGRIADGSIPDSIKEEFRAAFVAVEEALKVAGADGWRSVYKAQTYLTVEGTEGLPHYGELVKEFCGQNKPAQTAVTVPQLLWPKARIEIWVEGVMSTTGA